MFIYLMHHLSLSLNDHCQAQEHHEYGEYILNVLFFGQSCILPLKFGLSWLPWSFLGHLLLQVFVLYFHHLCFFLILFHKKFFFHDLGTHPIKSYVETWYLILKIYLKQLILLTEVHKLRMVTSFFRYIFIFFITSF